MLFLGYYFIKWKPTQVVENPPDHHASDSSVNKQDQAKKRDNILHGYKPEETETTLIQKPEVNQQPKANQESGLAKSPAEHYETTLRYYRSISENMESFIQNYNIREQETLKLLKSKKRGIDNYTNMMNSVKPTLEDAMAVMRMTNEMPIITVEGALSVVKLLQQFINDSGENLQKAGSHYEKSERQWTYQDKTEFKRHVKDIIHRKKEANHYFNEMVGKVDGLKKLMGTLTDMGVSTMNLNKDLKNALENRENMDDQAIQKLKKEKQWEVSQLKVKNQELMKKAENQIKEINWLYEKLESHFKMTNEIVVKALEHFPIKRGLIDSLKKLDHILYKKKEN